MNRQQADHLAALIRTIRPNWDHLATLNALTHIDATLPAAAQHALTIADNPNNQTPAALTFNPPTAAPNRPSHEPTCTICGLTRQQCEYRNRPGGPYEHHDPHTYEPRTT